MLRLTGVRKVKGLVDVGAIWKRHAMGTDWRHRKSLSGAALLNESHDTVRNEPAVLSWGETDVICNRGTAAVTVIYLVLSLLAPTPVYCSCKKYDPGAVVEGIVYVTPPELAKPVAIMLPVFAPAAKKASRMFAAPPVVV